jgi:hypothetical protein
MENIEAHDSMENIDAARRAIRKTAVGFLSCAGWSGEGG